MSKIAKPLQDHEVEFVDEDDSSVAEQDGHRPDRGGSIEAKWASGHTRVAGKHVTNPGLLTCDGRAKILPESLSAEQLDEWTEQAEEFAKVAKQVLHGRNATIFEHRVLNPMLGQPGRPVDDLAAQFNVAAKRIYKLEAQALKKVQAAVLRHKQGKSLKDERACIICGRTDSDGTMCPRGNYGPASCKWQEGAVSRATWRYFGFGLHHDLRPSWPISIKRPK
jgi:hypothetical protein